LNTNLPILKVQAQLSPYYSIYLQLEGSLVPNTC